MDKDEHLPSATKPFWERATEGPAEGGINYWGKVAEARRVISDADECCHSYKQHLQMLL